jgi:hypothetical protein
MSDTFVIMNLKLVDIIPDRFLPDLYIVIVADR